MVLDNPDSVSQFLHLSGWHGSGKSTMNVGRKDWVCWSWELLINRTNRVPGKIWRGAVGDRMTSSSWVFGDAGATERMVLNGRWAGSQPRGKRAESFGCTLQGPLWCRIQEQEFRA